MKVTLTPQRSDLSLAASCDGDLLVVNGETFDFAALPDGYELPPGSVSTPFIVGPVQRVSGAIELSLAVPYGVDQPPCQECVKDVESGAIWP